MKFAVYDKATGQVTQVVSGPDETSVPPLSGEQDFVSVGTWVGGYIEERVVKPFPPRPSENHTFDYTSKTWKDLRTPETEWVAIRIERDRRIAVTDWTQLPDVPLATKDAWATYRRALRDITLQPDPFNIVWPTPPANS